MISSEGLNVGKTISNDVWVPRSGVESFCCDVQYGEDGKRLETSHLGPIRQGARQRNKEVHALELPTRPIRGTSVAPALLPRASIPDLIYG